MQWSLANKKWTIRIWVHAFIFEGVYLLGKNKIKKYWGYVWCGFSRCFTVFLALAFLQISLHLESLDPCLLIILDGHLLKLIVCTECNTGGFKVLCIMYVNKSLCSVKPVIVTPLKLILKIESFKHNLRIFHCIEKSCFCSWDIKFLSILISDITTEFKIFFWIYFLNSKSFEHETWATASQIK